MCSFWVHIWSTVMLHGVSVENCLCCLTDFLSFFKLWSTFEYLSSNQVENIQLSQLVVDWSNREHFLSPFSLPALLVCLIIDFELTFFQQVPEIWKKPNSDDYYQCIDRPVKLSSIISKPLHRLFFNKLLVNQLVFAKRRLCFSFLQGGVLMVIFQCMPMVD